MSIRPAAGQAVGDDGGVDAARGAVTTTTPRSGAGRRGLGTRAVAADALLAAVLGALGIVAAPFIDGGTPSDRAVDLAGLALIVAAAAPLVVRRRWPVAVMALVGASASAYLIVGYPYGPILFSLAVAVYTAARLRPLGTAGPWSAGVGAVLLLHVFTNDAAIGGVLGLAPGSAWVVVPFAVGLARRMVSESGDRDRADAQRRLLDDERLRVAQEVHDIVGHGLAAIQMQADIALHLETRKPGQAHVALDAISRTSADALAELRSTLGSVRRDPSAADDARAPTPGLDRVDELCRRIEAAGVTVEVSVTGRRRAVPPAVDVAAYRIVQESLTNVVKHAADRRATVGVHYDDAAVRLRVTNQARVGATPGTGLGIAGMHRRVAALGGHLTAGADTHPGVFAVAATIPTEESA